jgi:uncharacterized protein involved in outer membrane biogenesis
MKRSLRLLFVLLILLLGASSGFSLALRGGWAKRMLLSRISASFGRPVEVGRFGFSLLRGFRLEAQSVTVAEDPQFGQEYFLRADKLSASVRWSALIRGRLELQTISLSRPSLNLVRLSDGRWNIESWLPPLPRHNQNETRGRPVSFEAGLSASASRFSRIQVETGRINFKRDNRKLPLALSSVSGRLDYDGFGHWNIDLQANPLRAPASLQQAGTLRLQGVVGGVSARLRPATLKLAWENASLADLSRLFFGADYGLRGSFGGELSAKIAESPLQTPALDWDIDGTFRTEGVHGWALPFRSDDPGLTATFRGICNFSEYRLQLTEAALESPHSHVSGRVSLNWSHTFNPEIEINSAHLSVGELLAWRRAFSPVTENLTADGILNATFTGSGWPVRIQDFSFQSEGADVRLPEIPQPIRLGPFGAQWANGSINLKPVSIFLPASAAVESTGLKSRSERDSEAIDPPRGSNSFRLEATLSHFENLEELRRAAYSLKLSGATGRSQDFLALARAWRGSTATWNITGPVALQVVLKGAFQDPEVDTNGIIQAHDIQLSTPILNEPVLISSAALEFKGDQRNVRLTYAQAFGAKWIGTVRKGSGKANWEFDLSADRLDVSGIDHWLSAQAPRNILRRIFPFSDSNAPQSQIRAEALASLHARGRLRIGEISFAELNAEKLDSIAILDGPSLILTQGRTNILGAQFSGDLEAQFTAEPSFSVKGQFAHLDLGELSQRASLPGHLSGETSGELQLAAYGADRNAIARSLQGRGVLRIRDGSSHIQWPEIIATTSASARPPAPDVPFSMSADFEVGGSHIQWNKVEILSAADQFQGSGTLDFARHLDLRLQAALPKPMVSPVQNGSLSAWTITGTLDAPRVEPVSAPAAGIPLASR